MLSLFEDYIYKTTTNSLLIYNRELVLVGNISIESPSVLHQRFIAFDKKLYVINSGKLIDLFTFKRQIAEIRTLDRRIFIRNVVQNIFFTEQQTHPDTKLKDSFSPLSLIFSHHCTILSFFSFKNSILFADQHKLVLLSHQGVIERIILEQSKRAWIFNGFLIHIHQNELKIASRPLDLLSNNRFEHTSIIELKKFHLPSDSTIETSSLINILLYKEDLLLHTRNNLILCDMEGNILDNLQYSTEEVFIENEKIIITGKNGLEYLKFESGQ